MNALTVPLASIPPSGLEIEADVDLASVQPVGAADTESIPVDVLHVQGALAPAGSEYVFSGTVSGVFKHECDRCLDAVTTPFDSEVEMYFRQAAVDQADTDEDSDEEPEAVYPIVANEIDLGPAIWEEVALVVPAKHLCSEDCAGLCPHCGVNRNRESCACAPEPEAADEGGVKPLENKGLAGLAELFPELKPKHSEE